MIYSDSRYADGNIFVAADSRKNTYEVTVYRAFPTVSSEFFLYEWVQGDRPDTVAHKLLGSSDFWWKILDINPEIINPLHIPIGTALRIPNA
jgi:hypothetical protein